MPATASSPWDITDPWCDHFLSKKLKKQAATRTETCLPSPSCRVHPGRMPNPLRMMLPCCSYLEAWDSFVDAWLVVRVEDPQYAYKWRLQAEHGMRDSGKPAMTDAQVNEV